MLRMNGHAFDRDQKALKELELDKARCVTPRRAISTGHRGLECGFIFFPFLAAGVGDAGFTNENSLIWTAQDAYRFHNAASF